MLAAARPGESLLVQAALLQALLAFRAVAEQLPRERY